MKNFWIPEANFVTGEPGPRPIDLMQYQQDCLAEALSRDENGNFHYSIILWSDIKKSAKSSIAAAVALYMAWLTEWAEIYLIANDLKQADSRVGKYARRAAAYPPLKDIFRNVRYQIHGNNHSIIECLPIDPEGEAGSNADMIQFSELWGAQDEAKSRMYTEMTLSPTKFGKSFRWIESYAGYVEESEILWELWDLGVNRGELLWPDKLYPVTNGSPMPIEAYVNRDARLFCLWNTVPRCPWQTKEYYASEESILHPSEFLRMHRNQWIQQTETFVPAEWWDACEVDELPAMLPNQPMVVSMDAATTDDSFGIIMAGRHPLCYGNDAELVEKHKDDVVVYYSRCWYPKGYAKIDFVGTEEEPGPELELRRLIEQYNVVQVAYDPYQLHYLANKLQKEHLTWFYEFPQGGGQHSRLWADNDLYSKIRDRHIIHAGDIDLRAHVQHADAKTDEQERKKRIVKRTQKLKIDLCVALSMAVYQTHRLVLA